MKRTLMLALPLLLVASAVAGELEIGADLPLADVKMADVSGKKVSLNDAMGENGLLVVFSCNTCPWVDAWEDRYVKVSKKYQKKGVGMIAVNPNEASRKKGDSMDDMKARAKKAKYDFYYTVDEESKLASAFGATRTPHIYLFNKKGTLVYRGAIDDNARRPRKVESAYLMDAIDAMIAGKQIKTTSTKALGCSIKFASEQ
ncbi:MAG: thioredoxin family protein [Candidatus Marinimicrobia bacterium]|nr:thioredoxin family protein [Candidatus Neomarinimicrobiota bacterium]|tara:strand:+ start:1772 stop:2374 length:603 start_codon:yes stop_codon:yes gene_type:complete